MCTVDRYWLVVMLPPLVPIHCAHSCARACARACVCACLFAHARANTSHRFSHRLVLVLGLALYLFTTSGKGHPLRLVCRSASVSLTLTEERTSLRPQYLPLRLFAA